MDSRYLPTEATVTASGESRRSVADEPEQELGAGTRVGRYLIIERIGAGAMGFVYAAYDPELDRRIAIKILRTVYRDTKGRERALREAQSMAKLSHPNVVSVYDVGTFGDQLFVAMELVEGETFKEWMARAPRTWREVLRVLAAAGRGLAAAHAAGIVHRDVKPDNILVNRVGQARVVDFGVAQNVAGNDKSDAVAGTPAYMAPEQRRGAATAKSDQFSFCVTLSEALQGFRPAASSSATSSSTATALPAPASGPAKRAAIGRAPARVRRALRRGLSEDPDRRFDSMGALLEHLDIASRRRVVTSVAALAIVGIAGGAAALLAAGDGASGRCESAAATIDRIWSAERGAAIERAMASVDASHAEDTASRLVALLGERATGWATTRRAVCEATWVTGEQSEVLLDVRMQCLDRRLNEMTSLIELLSGEVDRDLLNRAVDATMSLESARSCAGLARADAGAYPLPDDPSTRARIDALYKQIDQLRVLLATGRYAQGVEAGQAIEGEAEALGYAPARAELLFVLGRLLNEAGQSQKGEAMLSRALVAAAEAYDPNLAVRIGTERLFIVGSSMGHYAEALTLLPDLEAALVRADAGPLLRAGVERVVGAVYMTKGDYAGARSHMERAVALFDQAEKEGYSGVTKVSTLNNLGIILSELGLRDQALPYLEQSVDAWEKRLGAEHPAVAIGLNNLGGAYQDVGRHDDALRVYSRALDLWERAHGPDHPDVAIGLLNVGQMLSKRGQFVEAEVRYRRALAICEAKLEPQHPNLGIALSFVGSALSEQGKHGEALPFHRRALDILRAAVDEDSEFMGVALLGHGAALAGSGDLAGGIQRLERAAEILAAVDSSYGPEASFALARALWEAGRDRERARQLAESALEEWQRTGSEKRLEGVVEVWLHQRPSP